MTYTSTKAVVTATVGGKAGTPTCVDLDYTSNLSGSYADTGKKDDNGKKIYQATFGDVHDSYCIFSEGAMRFSSDDGSWEVDVYAPRG